jgi:UDP-2,3-diacylglucosamine pyrophosphatase LpxH
MLKNVFVISDIELGQGDIFDDFKDEAALLSFLKKITAEKGKNILVLNGDTFDFMKMPYLDKFTHHITEEISLWKLNRILETYPKIFVQLQEFLNKTPNKIHFNIGNHDFDLLWPAVQQKLKKVLGNANKISFGHFYQDRNLHIEHGNQVDYFYKMDVEKPFVTHKGKQLLNLPMGSVAVIKYFIELKRHFPLEETIYPRHKAFEDFPEFKKMKQKIVFNFVLKGLLFNFIISIGDPISNVPYINLIKHVFAHGLEVYDETKFVHKRFKNIVKLNPGRQVYLMGHIHMTHHNVHPVKNHTQIVTDTWREEYSLHNHQKVLKAKTYAHIIYENDQIRKVDLLTYS